MAGQIRGIAAGDPEAKAWLYDRFAPQLFRRLRTRHGSDPQLDPEELLHDLFVWCFQANAAVLMRFVENSSPEELTEARLNGYLWGLVSGLVSNRRRSAERAPAASSIDSFPVADRDDPERIQVERDSAHRLTDCLKQSGSRLFAYFTLRFVEGLTPEEITAVTGWEQRKTYKLRSALNAAVERCVEVLGL